MKILFALIFILSLLLLPTRSYAQENFSTTYSVTYTVADDARTKALFTVALTNKSSQLFASSYALQVGFDTIENVIASDKTGQIAPKVTKNDAGNLIELRFNEKVVGLNNTQRFTIEFETPDIAKKQGTVWEINVPGVAKPDDFADYTVEIIPPVTGTPTYIKPAAADGDLLFSKKELGTSGISLAFGDKQHLTYSFVYHLKNPNLFPITSEIALPPSTNYQDVAITNIQPKPDKVTTDKDGNWLAHYHLSPAEEHDVIVKGNVRISLYPKKEKLAAVDRALYLNADRFWQVDNPEVQKLARQLKTPENIYRYVVKTLKYDFSRVVRRQERLGAVRVLADPDTAVCLEFTDLFITLARAAGIPARELNGFAYSENSKQRPLSRGEDILHAWPEYYDDVKQTWVMVDPTWGNTTGGTDYFKVFDVDHFVFVRKGLDSRYPIPAGGYKYEEHTGKKDLTIAFTTIEPLPAESLAITPNTASIYASALPISGTLVVSNVGQIQSRPQQVYLRSQDLTPRSQSFTIPALPPYGTHEIPFSFDRTSLLTNSTYEFTIDLSGKTSYHTIRVTPFVMTKIRVLGGVLIGLLGIGLFIIIYETRRLRLSRRGK